MNRILSVQPLAIGMLSERPYDALLATVGYERRARHVSQKFRPEAAKKFACSFADRKVCSFVKNYDWFAANDFTIEEVADSAAEEWATHWLGERCRETRQQDELSLCVDVSSMSRLRIASLIAAIMRGERPRRVVVDFLYAVAKWSKPVEEPEPIVYAGAVLPFFGGWSSKPELPSVALIGLGYEPDKAVGAYEYLEATRVWSFVPVSDDERYTRDIGRANESLFRRIPQKQQISYEVSQPFTTFGVIESVVYGELTGSRPVLLPFGPKIFALCAMLVACVHRDVPVWRISSGQYGKPVDRVAAGPICGIRVKFGPSVQATAKDIPPAKGQRILTDRSSSA